MLEHVVAREDDHAVGPTIPAPTTAMSVAACLARGNRAPADEARFADFTSKPVADARTATEAIFCLSALSRDDVDALADAALAAGGGVAGEPMDHGFMYGRSFTDPDGHLWEVMWMSTEAIEQGPADMAQPA